MDANISVFTVCPRRRENFKKQRKRLYNLKQISRTKNTKIYKNYNRFAGPLINNRNELTADSAQQYEQDSARRLLRQRFSGCA